MKTMKTNYWLDALMFAGFMAALQPRLTGMTIHEWLSLAAAATLVLHVVLHWDWAVGVTRTFFHNLFHVSRLNYVVDALLFVAFTVAITSGLIISKVVMPAFGLQMLAGHSWAEVHKTTADATLLLVGLHFALHWSWISNTFHRLLIAPFKRRSGRAQPAAQPLPIPINRIKAL